MIKNQQSNTSPLLSSEINSGRLNHQAFITNKKQQFYLSAHSDQPYSWSMVLQKIRNEGPSPTKSPASCKELPINTMSQSARSGPLLSGARTGCSVTRPTARRTALNFTVKSFPATQKEVFVTVFIKLTASQASTIIMKKYKLSK